MPLVNSNAILAHARKHKYGIPSLLAGNAEMIVGQIKAAESLNAPLILAFNQGATPTIPLEIGMALAADAARKASVPVATILDHGANIEQIVVAMRNGTSSVMFDGSTLPYEENVRQTQAIVSIAHAVGVDVEAELGGVGGSSIYLGDEGPGSSMTDPDQAVDFVERTGIDVLAISFGNSHGVYRTKPVIDLERVRAIHGRVSLPLVMHGGSGLEPDEYAAVIASGISKVCYYTVMGRAASRTILQKMNETDPETLIYHQIIAQATDFFTQATKELMTLLGCAGKAAPGK
ncbi:MAG: class II fructose-bisphosphate aldolase [Caldilineaceae bacterium]|nr:class II fructose-bisphosphate aldolase [Caldilineaceae bacterium]MBP8109008.1 class II fructose-bisphosphate aldolase [Caldilineaceae bacterium]MBP8124431.1 class II fructose-bisphosphate aldolase [Caldilineaceae bacterium]MBP9073937.1 class II fructose-bisphosphate aldolase [Caldilineaceae bacterium]